MGEAKICDRCKKFYVPYPHDLTIMRAHLTVIYDLCPFCNETLKEWLNDYKEAPNGGEQETQQS